MCAPRVETAKDGCGRGNLTPTTRHYRYGPGMLSGARATEGIRCHGRRYPRPLTAAALLDSLKIRPEASPVSWEHQAQNQLQSRGGNGPSHLSQSRPFLDSNNREAWLPGAGLEEGGSGQQKSRGGDLFAVCQSGRR